MQSQQQTPPDQRWTVMGLLKWTTDYFARHTIDSPRLTAEVLTAHALALRRIDLYLRYDQPLTREELARIKPLIRRRVAREPVAYITGEKEFWSLSLKVGPDALIPRPDTEVLVETVLRRLGRYRKAAILELGTGSGAISLALAREAGEHRYYASDRSTAALALASANAGELGMRNRIHFFAADWFGALDTRRRFDFILSNPPYIRRGELATLQPEVRCFEPRQALDGGESGLDAISLLIREAPRHLEHGACLVMEIGHDQSDAVRRLVEHSGEYSSIRFVQDLAGIERVVVAERG
jgi:release factor glutamine methyltransferase